MRGDDGDQVVHLAVRLVSNSLDNLLVDCPSHIVEHLRQSVTCCQAELRDHAVCIAHLEEVKAFCDAKFVEGPWQEVKTGWRRAYTDAAILKACLILLSAKPALSSSSKRQRLDCDGDAEALLDAIKTLDLAIIVAGTPGPQRREVVLQLIATAQERLTSHKSAKRLRAEERIHPAPPSPASPPLVRATNNIQALPSPPTFTTFASTHSRQPFILRRFAGDWPAVQADGPHSWASGEYLIAAAGGPGRVVPVEVGGAYTDDDWGQQIIPWTDFLARSGWGGDEQRGDAKLYLAQHTLFQQFTALEDDVRAPDYVWSAPDPPEHMPEYRPPSRRSSSSSEDDDDADAEEEEDVVKSAWVGPEGTVSPAHTDPYFNCYVQVVGRKLVWIAPPDVTTGAGGEKVNTMYCFGQRRPPLEGCEEDDDGADDEWQGDGVTSMMTNTSRVDVFAPPPVDVDEHPVFTDVVEPRAQWAILEPGDMLFLPPGWWHAMKSLTKSFSVSFWF